jgi:hypothetical protein
MFMVDLAENHIVVKLIFQEELGETLFSLKIAIVHHISKVLDM